MNDYDHLVFTFVTPETNPALGSNFRINTYLDGEQASIRGASVTVLFDGNLMQYVSFNHNVFPGIWIGNNAQLFSAATQTNYITRDISTFGAGNLATSPGNTGQITMTPLKNGTSPLFYWDNYQGDPNINPKVDLELSPGVITQVNNVNKVGTTVTIGSPQTALTDGFGTTNYNTLRDVMAAISAGTHTGNLSVAVTDSQYVMQSLSLPASGTGSADYSSVSYSVDSGKVLRIYEGGALTLGENQHLQVGSGAVLTVDEGASLTFGSGSTFINQGTFDEAATFQKLVSKPDYGNLPGDNTQGIWVALSAPAQGNYSGSGGLLDHLWTQGFPGSDSSSGVSNVLLYDETVEGSQLDRYVAPAGNTITPGKGFIVYLYEHQYNESGPDLANPVDYNTPLSMTGRLNVTDAENAFTFDVTNENDGYNLLGNPYGSSLSWDLAVESGKWVASNLESFAYVLNPATQQFQAIESGGGGKTIPGVLSSAVIDPFDAFWVVANGANPSLKVNEAALVSELSGRVLGVEEVLDSPDAEEGDRPDALNVSQSAAHDADQSASQNASKSAAQNAAQPVFTLTLDIDGMESHTGFRFDEGFVNGLTDEDARFFSPLGSSFAYLFSQVDGAAVMLNSLDRHETVEVGLTAGGYQNGVPASGEAELRLNVIEGAIEDWGIILRDNATGMKYDLQDGPVMVDLGAGAGTLNINPKTHTVGEMKVAHVPPVHILQTAEAASAGPVMNAALYTERFTLMIDPALDEVEPLNPEQISLNQNYPNPFNPTTTLSFDLEVAGNVALSVFSVDGRKVADLMSGRREAGSYEVVFDGSGLASGLYVYRLSVTDEFGVRVGKVKKMTLLK